MKLTTIAFVSLSLLGLDCSDAQAAPQPYEYMRGEYSVPCEDNESEICIWHRLVVDNQTANTLECRSRMVYDGANRRKLTTLEHPMVVEPKVRKSVIADMTKPEVKATSHSVDCVVRPPLSDANLTTNCKPTLIKKPEGIDYPSASRLASEEGPVILEFSLTDKEAAPTDIVVVSSSLWPKLDASAIKYVGQHTGVTDCKKGRFRMPLTFRLR